MSWTGWLLFIIAVQVIHFLGTWKLYVKAGRHAWEAAVPVYNAVVLMKIINRPWWWTILLFIPIVNLIMFPVVWVETLRSFGKNSMIDTLLGVLTCGLYIYYINYTQDVKYIEDRSLKPRTSGGEWVSSILFAVVAATIVHTYVMQPFTIPTSSLEKTLLVGDFLFVSKFHYGARLPMTPLSFPMVHDTIPVVKSKSYIKKPQIPYFRFPGFQKIKRNDIVVFSWPTDTLTNITDPFSKVDIKPLDKKSNYVKRCVGLPGDSLSVRDGYVFINGEQNKLPSRAKLQFAYAVQTNSAINPQLLMDRYNLTDRYQYDNQRNVYYFAAISDESLELLKKNPSVVNVVSLKGKEGEGNAATFPQDPNYNWNTDYFGALYIPKAGATVAITPETLPLYRRIIEVYEGSEIGYDNKITQSGTEVLLNGSPLTEYTFKLDYYWMMGDNRNNSQDARMWGFVPFTHVLGKPVFVWMSWDTNAKGIMNKIRWERMFTTVGGEGAPVSYFKYFLVFLAGWFIFDFFRKRKKKVS
ncbi:signal peptidase I [Ulvibacter antarcticus]|uniref:Signal peptidase I n=1 Tax=Ulvibacter antarcticus TaxID=442714 RepID=A0A3L9Z3G4_9FLAO|nr:signal peptidase I [Ulvibacter antarcticus]RMA64845.1 signal peptidase I [Ulvibacter antarcticus]